VIRLLLALVLIGCGTHATSGSPGAPEPIRDTTFSGHCAIVGGMFGDHCQAVSGDPKCSPCSPDMTWDWADPGQPLSPDWVLTGSTASTNNCVRMAMYQGAANNAATVTVETSEDGKTVDQTIAYVWGGTMACTYQDALIWEGP
jgi:hypothetical protein